MEFGLIKQTGVKCKKLKKQINITRRTINQSLYYLYETKREQKTSLSNIFSNNEKHIKTAPLKRVAVTEPSQYVHKSVNSKLNPPSPKNLHPRQITLVN